MPVQLRNLENFYQLKLMCLGYTLWLQQFTCGYHSLAILCRPREQYYKLLMEQRDDQIAELISQNREMKLLLQSLFRLVSFSIKLCV